MVPCLPAIEYDRDVRLLALAVLLGGCYQSHQLPSGPGVDASVGRDGGRDGGLRPRFAGSWVSETCGPTDGPAIELILYERSGPNCTADPTGESVRFYLYGPYLPITPGESVSSDGTVTHVLGPSEVSTDFLITFDTFEPGVGASGNYRVTWHDGWNSFGSFHAVWCSTGPVICG